MGNLPIPMSLSFWIIAYVLHKALIRHFDAQKAVILLHTFPQASIWWISSTQNETREESWPSLAASSSCLKSVFSSKCFYHLLLLFNRKGAIPIFTGPRFSVWVLWHMPFSWCPSLLMGTHPAGAPCTTNKALRGVLYQRLHWQRSAGAHAQHQARERLQWEPQGCWKVTDSMGHSSACCWHERGCLGELKLEGVTLVNWCHSLLSAAATSWSSYSFHNPAQSCWKWPFGILHATSLEMLLLWNRSLLCRCFRFNFC